MDYSQYTKEQLIEIIDELKMFNNELWSEKIQEDKLTFAWAGNLGHWYLNFKTNNVIFNPLKIAALGYHMDELPENVSYSFFTDKLHPDDYENTMKAMIQNMEGKLPVYECEYRIQTKDGNWKWFYDRGKVTQRDQFGNPVFAAGIVFEITNQKEKEQRLEFQNKQLEVASITDELTGIKNRRAILEELNSRMEEAQKYGSPLSITLVDIDNFKNINDTYGHILGDKILKDVANIISENIRGLDAIGRYGGEEFLLILPNTNIESAKFVSDKIRSEIEAFSFDVEGSITISGGVAYYNDNNNMQEFIDRADKKLYEAKGSGKNIIIE